MSVAAITDRDDVAGSSLSTTGGPPHGFLRNKRGQITVFDVSGATGTVVTGMNDAGTIVGYSTNAQSVETPFMRTPDGTITSLTISGPGVTLPGTRGVAYSINTHGEIAGCYADASGGAVFRSLFRRPAECLPRPARLPGTGASSCLSHLSLG